MQLPNASQAVVSSAKILDYLLSDSHPHGRGKARFFVSHGFLGSDWGRLATALRRHALLHPVCQVVESRFGVRYVIEGGLSSPDGRVPSVRTVWFIRFGREIPEFVTAYPVRLRSSQ
jgi:hypothetical protein